MLASAQYSFTWGDAHVTVLDSNRYVNWTDASLRRWLEADLLQAQRSRWRFVLMHHPPFNRSSEHRSDQWTRYFAPLFEQYRVTAVFGEGESLKQTRGTEVSVKIAASGNKRTVELTWLAVPGVTSYRVYRKTGDGDWEGFVTVAAGTTTFSPAARPTTKLSALRPSQARTRSTPSPSALGRSPRPRSVAELTPSWAESAAQVSPSAARRASRHTWTARRSKS